VTLSRIFPNFDVSQKWAMNQLKPKPPAALASETVACFPALNATEESKVQSNAAL
jgi:hypothetical protein